MPEELRKLQEPWLEGVPEELQRYIRFGARLEIDAESGKPYVDEWLSGGAGTIMSTKLSEDTYNQLKTLMEMEYFPRDSKLVAVGFGPGSSVNAHKIVADDIGKQIKPDPGWVVERAYVENGEMYVDLKRGGWPCTRRKMRYPAKNLEMWNKGCFVSCEEAEEARKNLEGFLSERGVSMDARRNIPSAVFNLTKELYEILPRSHFGHGHFKELKIGGWYGGGAAKCSAHEDPVVSMFDFVVGGPRRNYAALLLHETGHSHFAKLCEDGEIRKRIEHYYKRILKTKGFFALDYLFGRQSRVNSYAVSPDEFASEFYLFYVAGGEKFHKFIASLDRNSGWRYWMQMYNIFMESFGGTKYL